MGLLNVRLRFLNTRSLKNKFNEFIAYVILNNMDMYFVCETWHDNSVIDTMVKPDNYKMIRNDRTNGVCRWSIINY